MKQQTISPVTAAVPTLYQRLLTLIVTMLFLCHATLPASAQTVPPLDLPDQVPGEATISSRLSADLAEATAPVSFLVVLREQVDVEQVTAAAALRSATRTDKAVALYRALTAHARRSQVGLRAWLDTHGIAYQAFYLVNMIEVQGDLALAKALQTRPEVARLVANPLVQNALTVSLDKQSATWDQVLHRFSSPPAQTAVPYGLDYTNATDVWALGYTGQGIVVAGQDTGVEWDHPALQAQYRGMAALPVDHAYDWFDAWGLQGRPARCAADAQVPCDDHGHGTHTVGTMVGDATGVGDTALGMAPDAQWIACRNMRNGFGTPASYTACFQFFLAPYPQDGDPFTDGQPELAPHIINNSWGCPPSEGCDVDSLRQVVETVRAAGMMVVASAGNDGSGCFSVQDPIAIHDATLSVGAHNASGTIASFSSRGPVTVDGSNRLKPDISAPGVGVRSTWVNGGYSTIQGTSMAAPHVAGGVALLWSAVPALIGNIDLTEQVLLKSATPVPANSCGEGASAVVPNNTYGYGRLNILAAVQTAQAPAALIVTVVDGTGNPIANRAVTLIDQLTGYQSTAITGADGRARLEPIYAGAYTALSPGSTAAVVTIAAGAQQQIGLTGTAPGDCNGDSTVDAGDLAANVLEIFDGDGSAAGAADGGSYLGTVGCNANQDARIDAADLSCTVLLIFNGPAACAAGE